MIRDFLSRMVGCRLTVTGTIDKISITTIDPVEQTICVKNPVTVKGTPIGSHVWIRESMFKSREIPDGITIGSKIRFKCIPYGYSKNQHSLGEVEICG